MALHSPRGRICCFISKGTERMMRGTEKKGRASTIGPSWDWVGERRPGQGQLKVVCINAKLGSPPLFCSLSLVRYTNPQCPVWIEPFWKSEASSFTFGCTWCKSVARGKKVWPHMAEGVARPRNSQILLGELLSTIYCRLQVWGTYSDKLHQNCMVGASNSNSPPVSYPNLISKVTTPPKTNYS